MNKKYRLLSLLLCAVLLAGILPAVAAPAAQAAENDGWIATWSTSLVDPSVSIAGVNFQDVIPINSTLRTEIIVTTSGSKLRFTFSNEYGRTPLTINGASVARTDGQYEAKIVNGTQTAITFGGGASVVIPAGQRAVSDAIPFETKALDKLSVSTFIEHTYYISSAGLSNGRTYMNADGFLIGKSRINEPSLSNSMEISLGSGTITYHTIPFLEEIDSYSDDPQASCAVFIGDSTLVNDTYLDYARRVVSAGRDNISIINKAIIGNKLLSNGTGIIGKLYGDAMIDRFKKDVLEVSGVKYCFVKIGLNDVLHQFSKSLSAATPKYTADEIIAGYKTLISLAHQRGIKIYFFTKSAWNGYQRAFLGMTDDLSWNAAAQKMCDELTEWIKTNTLADGMIDCSPLADPSDPTKLCSTLTLDGAHLSDLGSVALADLIPLEYVGLESAKGKTAAEIMNADPYAEKNAIIKRMNEPKNAIPVNKDQTPAPTGTQPTAAAEQQTTISYVPVTQSTTAAPSTMGTPATAAPSTTAAADPSAYLIDAITPVDEPSISLYTPDLTTGLPQQNVDFNVQDDRGDDTSIGSGAPIAFILFGLMVMMIAAAVVVLTVGRKKEYE